MADSLRRQVGSEEEIAAAGGVEANAARRGAAFADDVPGTAGDLVTGAVRACLRIRNLSKRFGSFTALRDVSLDVHQGEFICFLGPSGCGKTTLLRAIAGLDLQSEGSIEHYGRDISRLPPSQRDFGIVFQSYALFPNLTVFQNVAYGLQSQRLARAQIEERVGELLALVGLPESARKYPAQLSGGQQQRVALARALATSPGLLLLDEPLSALDAKVRLRLRREVKQLQERLGVTTIMVTHDQEEALTMADRIVVMSDGAIAQVGTPREIYRNPASRFIADFVGTMNFLSGTVTADGGVRVGDLKLIGARAPQGLVTGAAVTACIRPEDIVLGSAAEQRDSQIDARIVEVEFLGSVHRVVLQSEVLLNQCIVADVPAGAMAELDFEAGATFRAGVSGRRVRVLPGSGA